MNVGTPGSGLGGLFYLASLIVMLFGQVWRTLKGQSSLARWRFVVGQLAIGGGIVAGIVATGWIISMVFPELKLLSIAIVDTGSAVAGATPVIPNIQVALRYLVPILITFSPLIAVLFIVQMVRLVLIAVDRPRVQRRTRVYSHPVYVVEKAQERKLK